MSYVLLALDECVCANKQALLEVCDRTGSVCVVLWNSVCLRWYRCVKPGDIISLRRYRVKRHYQDRSDDIGEHQLICFVEACHSLTHPVCVSSAEISVNSRNPAARICILQDASVAPEHLPPAPRYRFSSRSVRLLCRGPFVACV